MSLRFFTSAALTASLVGCVGLSIGCGASPTSPGPVAPPTVPAISPSRGLPGDRVSVTGSGFLAGATLTFDGVPAKVTSTFTNFIAGTTPFHSPGAVDVVVTNPDGTKTTLAGGFTYEVVSVDASPNQVGPGGQVTMNWVAPSGRGCNGGGDWVALFRVVDPDYPGSANGHSDLWYDHICGATSGTRTFNAPTQPGDYEIRFMVDEFPAARSGPETVR